jgi:hypothetical protein
MLHATRGCPAFVSIGVGQRARRAGSFHWTFVIEHSLSIDRVGKRGEPCRQRFTRSIEVLRSLGLPAQAQRFATIAGMACGCTYASSTHINFGYAAAIGQTRCICAEAFFLIRRSNNSVGTRRARRSATRRTRCQTRSVRNACRGTRIAGMDGPGSARACSASRARWSDAPCPASVTELGLLAYESGREARRPKGQRGRMSFSAGPAARPGCPERLHQECPSNTARLGTARPPRNPSSSSTGSPQARHEALSCDCECGTTAGFLCPSSRLSLSASSAAKVLRQRRIVNCTRSCECGPLR